MSRKSLAQGAKTPKLERQPAETEFARHWPAARPIITRVLEANLWLPMSRVANYRCALGIGSRETGLSHTRNNDRC